MSDDTTGSLLEELAVAGNTAELQRVLGAPVFGPDEDPEYTADNLDKLAAAVSKATDPTRSSSTGKVRPALKAEKQMLTQRSTAVGGLAFLKEYGSLLAIDVHETRNALTHKLLELANCGDPKHELRAIELLGKHSDINLFTERSEVTINYKSPEALEEAIKERVKRLLNAQVVDATPVGRDLDEELGIASPLDAEFEDVKTADDAPVRVYKPTDTQETVDNDENTTKIPPEDQTDPFATPETPSGPLVSLVDDL